MGYVDYGLSHDDYLYKYRSRYGNNINRAVYQPTSSSTNNGKYASGISDSGFFANTCTDGKDDGKIGFFSVAGNVLEGVAKGAVNGITGMLGISKDENGNTTWNPLKALGTVALGAACVMCPALGVAACAVGAVSGGVQVYKGAKAAANATTDAEAKAALENMGEGASTVVGCVIGAKASVGAMKNSSMAAVDDAIKSLDDGDKALKALKGIDKSNIDDVTAALEKANIKNIDEINNAIGAFGKDTSALGNLDDSLKGTDKLVKTMKAFGKDAVSSTKNNVNSFWTKASSTYKKAKSDIDDYTTAKAEKKQLESEINKMTKKIDSIDDADELMEMNEAIRLKKGMLETAEEKLNGTKIQQQKNNAAQVRNDIKTAQKEQSEAQKALNKAKSEAKTKAPKGTKKEALDEIVKTATKSERQALDDATKAVSEAKQKTTFGKLTSKAKETNLGQALGELKTDKNAIKNITSNMNKDTISKITNALGKDLQGVWQFLQSGEGTYYEAVNKYGYSNVAQVLQVLYAYGQTEKSV